MTQFETTCPNEHSVKFTLEMCGRMAQCPKCSARFEVPTLKDVREMLGDDMDADLEAEFKTAEAKLRELLRAKAAKRAQMEREVAEKVAAEKAEAEERARLEVEAREKAEAEAKEKAEAEAREKAEREKAEAEAAEAEMIQFLCPNGHALSAAPHQSGKKGRCPECGAKFMVPSVEAVHKLEEELTHEEEKATETTSEAEKEGESKKTEEVKPPKIAVSTDNTERAFLYPNLAVGAGGEIDLGLEEAIRSIPEAVKMDPMAKFFWTLWTSEVEPSDSSVGLEDDVMSASASSATPAHGIKSNLVGNGMRSAQSGKIEIQTADGKSFFPIEFYEDRSLSPIGFFEALDEERNPITLVIRWENVVRIVVRK